MGKGSEGTASGEKGEEKEGDHFNPLYCDSAAINLLIG